METYYIGFDIHKKTISFCMKKSNGDIIQEGKIIAGAIPDYSGDTNYSGDKLFRGHLT